MAILLYVVQCHLLYFDVRLFYWNLTLVLRLPYLCQSIHANPDMASSNEGPNENYEVIDFVF